MGKIHTYAEIASDYDLWMEFVEPFPAMTRENFATIRPEEKVQRQITRFGPEAARTLPEGLTGESVHLAMRGPREQRIRDLERILSILNGWETAAAKTLRSEAEQALLDRAG
jgi:hypothetical protein